MRPTVLIVVRLSLQYNEHQLNMNRKASLLQHQ